MPQVIDNVSGVASAMADTFKAMVTGSAQARQQLGDDVGFVAKRTAAAQEVAAMIARGDAWFTELKLETKANVTPSAAMLDYMTAMMAQMPQVGLVGLIEEGTVFKQVVDSFVGDVGGKGAAKATLSGPVGGAVDLSAGGAAAGTTVRQFNLDP